MWAYSQTIINGAAGVVLFLSSCAGETRNGPTARAETVEIAPPIEPVSGDTVEYDQGQVRVQVMVPSTALLRKMKRAYDRHEFEGEIPYELPAGSVIPTGVPADPTSFRCLSLDLVRNHYAVVLQFNDTMGSRYLSIGSYDREFRYLSSVVLEEWRATRKKGVYLLAGEVTFFNEHPLDYLFRQFDPNDSVEVHPNLVDAERIEGLRICEDGVIRCVLVPDSLLYRPAEVNKQMAHCTGC